MPSPDLSSVDFSATLAGFQAAPESMPQLERTLIVVWWALGFTAAKMQQRPRLLDSLGAPRFTLCEIEAVIRQVLTRNATPIAVDPVAADCDVVDVRPPPASRP